VSFFDELKRRNVIRIGIAYAAVAWLLAQIADLAFGAFEVPDWALRALLIGFLVGLPIALVIAWVYELTPTGVRVDEDGISDAPKGTERKLDKIIIGVLAAAVSVLLVERFYTSQAVSVGTTQSIAVLPFVNLSDDSDHFADGLSEELLNLLASNSDLKVAGRTSSFAFKGKFEDLREIGNSLGVDHLIEGSVRRSGKAFLDDYVGKLLADAAASDNKAFIYGPYVWYLAFGYVGEAWRAIERDRAGATSSWFDSDQIVIFGITFPGRGFTSDPRFVTPKLVQTWEMRGNPDRCDKIDGQWTCH